MSPITLYYMPVSSPCRMVMLTAKAVGVELNLKLTNLFTGEQMKPEFLAINPQHVLPTLVDGDFTLWESRAICTYLASEYGSKDEDSLYPTCPKKRALVDRLLYFDMGTLYHHYGNYVYPVMFEGQESPNPECLKKLHEALGLLNSYLSNSKWAAGAHVTVADHSLVATVSTIVESGFSIGAYPNIVTWYENCKKSFPGYDQVNGAGAKEMGNMVKAKLAGH